MCWVSWKFRSLNLLEPFGPHQACYRTALSLHKMTRTLWKYSFCTCGVAWCGGTVDCWITRNGAADTDLKLRGLNLKWKFSGGPVLPYICNFGSCKRCAAQVVGLQVRASFKCSVLQWQEWMNCGSLVQWYRTGEYWSSARKSSPKFYFVYHKILRELAWNWTSAFVVRRRWRIRCTSSVNCRAALGRHIWHRREECTKSVAL